MAKDINLFLRIPNSTDNIGILDSSIVFVEADALGSKVTYNDNGARLKSVVVKQTPAEIVALSEVTIEVTSAESLSSIFLNVNRMDLTSKQSLEGVDTLGTQISYNTGFNKRQIVVTENQEDLASAIGSL